MAFKGPRQVVFSRSTDPVEPRVELLYTHSTNGVQRTVTVTKVYHSPSYSLLQVSPGPSYVLFFFQEPSMALYSQSASSIHLIPENC